MGKWATGSDKKRAAKLAEAEGIGKTAALRIILKRKGKELPLRGVRETKYNSRRRKRMRATCERKQPYKTFTSASIGRKKIIAKKGLDEEGAKRLDIYVCEVCKNFHIGNTPNKPKGGS